MIIFRYFAREITTTLTAVMGVLLLIFLSNQFVRYLAKAAAGQLPAYFVLRLMMLEIPNLLGLLLPLGLFLSIILAYGRLSADSEMTVLFASGLSRLRILTMTLMITLPIAGFIALLSLVVSPHVSADRVQLLAAGGTASVIDTLIPGRFQTLGHGKQVVYVENVTRDRSRVDHLFAGQRTQDKEWEIITAEKGRVVEDQDFPGRFFVAENGQRYIGTPGKKDYEISRFGEYGIRLVAPESPKEKYDIRGVVSSDLWPINNKNPYFASEIQWRLSVPIMALVLAFIAVPLSRIKPRQGKYAKVIPAAVILITYANMMFVTRNWLRHGVISPELGYWWLHASFLAFGLLLFVIPWLRHTRGKLR